MDNTVKIQVFGGGAVGKTTAIVQFVQGHFVEDYDPWCDDSFRKQCTIDGSTVFFDINDDGYYDFRVMYETAIRSADVMFLMYSITSRQSFDDLQQWVDMFQRVKDMNVLPMVLVGNKVDLENERQVTTQEGKEYAQRYKCPFFEISAKTRVNIEEAFFEAFRVFSHGTIQPDDKTKRPIPALPGHYTTRPSRMRENFASMVDKQQFHDVQIVSDEWTKFKLLSIATSTKNSNFWIPPEVWQIVLRFCIANGFFSTRYKIFAHRCILLSRFPTLMEFIKESRLDLDLSQNYELPALQAVIRWLYCGQCTEDPILLSKMLPIASKLKLYNLVSICQGKGHQANQGSFSVGVLFNSEALSDCVLICSDNTKIFGHKAILYARSIYFHRRLTRPLSPDGSFIIEGDGPTNLVLIRHLYEDTPIPDNFIFEATSLCIKHWHDDPLSERLQAQILSTLNYNTVRDIYDWSQANPNAYLVQSGLRFWIGYRVAVMKKTPIWKDLPKKTQTSWEGMTKYGVWVEDKPPTKDDEKCIIS